MKIIMNQRIDEASLKISNFLLRGFLEKINSDTPTNIRRRSHFGKGLGMSKCGSRRNPDIKTNNDRKTLIKTKACHNAQYKIENLNGNQFGLSQLERL